MSWISIAASFGSAVLGGVIGGILTAYAIGRWRGEIDQRVKTLETANAHASQSRARLYERAASVAQIEQKVTDMDATLQAIDQRIARAEEQVSSLDVLHAKIDRATQDLEAFSGVLGKSMEQVQHQFDRGREIFVTQAVCNERCGPSTPKKRS